MYRSVSVPRAGGQVMAEVGTTQLRSEIKDWIARARAGEEVIVTERGTPVARIIGIGFSTAMEQLIADGLISQPKGPRLRATAKTLVHSEGLVSEYVTAERDARR